MSQRILILYPEVTDVSECHRVGCSRKDPPCSRGANFFLGGEEKILFLKIVSVLGHSKGVGGLTSNFLHGVRMLSGMTHSNLFHSCYFLGN
jgi:hypothetical protein